MEGITKRWPVAEIFGPTVQGEGVDQGVPSHFVRFGGCDFKCSWCDTPHAVLPEEVRTSERLSADEICARLLELKVDVPWIILTGGNPAMHDLTELVIALQSRGWWVAVETQGSRWKDWLIDVDRLCVSPKPPSSGMNYGESFEVLEKFMDVTVGASFTKPANWAFSKIVVFNDEDLAWANHVAGLYPLPIYLSAGNDAGRTVGRPTRIDTRDIHQVRSDLLAKSSWLVDEVLSGKYETLLEKHVKIQSQYHVLLWGNKLGV